MFTSTGFVLITKLTICDCFDPQYYDSYFLEALHKLRPLLMEPVAIGGGAYEARRLVPPHILGPRSTL